MTLKFSFRKIDELTIDDHYYLTKEDDCFYLAEYPSGNLKINKKNPVFSLISNLKKTMDRKGLIDWQYKDKAIKQCSKTLISLFSVHQKIDEFTIVPIPPSKIKSDPLYDDRLTKVLLGLKSRFPNCDVRELLYTNESTTPSHHSTIRPNIEELYNNLSIDESLCEDLIGIMDKVILFDDVLTTGTHFKACKKKILERFPDVKVIGLFITRRVLPSAMDVLLDDFSSNE